MARTPESPPRFHDLESDYQLVRELGRGGTSVVYLALERELGRYVAVKVIRAGYVDDPETVARMHREAKLVARLRHPNIVTLYGTRRLADNSLALVMQYVPGRTLKATVRDDGAMPTDSVIRVVRDMAKALVYAHERHGVVHRDIKPENIYLDQEQGAAVLSDFGIARFADSGSNITIAGMALGTPAYMSPEQIDGDELDGRSDLYSLGLVVYEMLTGKPRWAGQNLYTIIYKQKHETLPPIEGIRPGVPRHLCRAIDGLLHKDRESRWSSAREFLAQLDPSTVVPRFRMVPPAAAGPVHEPLPGPDVSASRYGDADAPTLRYRVAGVGPTSLTGDEPPSLTGDEPPSLTGDEPPSRTGDEPPSLTGDEPPSLTGSGAAGAKEVRTPVTASPAVARGDGDMPAPAERRRRVRPAAGIAAALILAASTVTVATITGRDDPEVAYPVAVAEPTEIARPDEIAAAVPSDVTEAIRAGAPERILVLAGDGQRGIVGEALSTPIAVKVEDANGRPVPGARVEFSLTTGAGAVTPAETLTDSAGLAMASWTLGREAGENEVMVHVEGVPEALERLSADGLPGRPVRIAVLEGEQQQAAPGTTLPRQVGVRVEDEFGNPIEGAAVEFRVENGGGTVSPGTALTEDGGVAHAAWTLGAAQGQHRLRLRIPDTGVDATVSATARLRLAVRRTIVAGGTSTCVLEPGGSAYCWGGNDKGQLGSGSTGRLAGPVQVAVPTVLAVMDAGVSHTCGLDTAGGAYCWGANGEGQLGTGGRSDAAAPARVAGSAAFRDIATGLSHTCAIEYTGGISCWGANGYGQLGDGTHAPRNSPARVGASGSYRTVAAGWNHTCALDRDQRAYCWGANEFGQLGDGTTTNRAVPVRVGGDMRYSSISAGAAHTCAITTAGSAYCWGQNLHGQLGTGTKEGRARPTRVRIQEPFAAVSAGAVHTCGLTRAGTPFCWGRNVSGQLGDGTMSDSPAPEPVAADLRFATLHASGSHTCGLTVGGEPYCWGYNVEGQLGDGSRVDRSRPVRGTAPGQ